MNSSFNKNISMSLTALVMNVTSVLTEYVLKLENIENHLIFCCL